MEASESDQHQAAKRLKSGIARMEDVVSREILDSKDTIRKSYAANKPYPHAVLPHVFDEDFLNKVFKEIQGTSQVSFKESDLFRVYQSIDFANLTPEKHQDSLPTVLQLREILCSESWRNFIEDITGLERNTLLEQIDSAVNCHTTGCHLLTHDDVIGTRKISYIIYMTEPDWKVSEGGALELYDSHITTDVDGNELRVPDSTPSKTVLPLFNHLALFEVVPGLSFHAVQEVFGDRPRLSLQGWYHAKEAPTGIENATLGRLKNEQDKEAEGEFVPIEPVGDVLTSPTENPYLIESDIAYLGRYLDETYLKSEAIDEIRDLFSKESSVQLQNFFQSKWVDKLLQLMKETQDLSPDDSTAHDLQSYCIGASESWKLVGPPHKQRFLEYAKTPPSDISSVDDLNSVGEIISHLRQVMESPPFYRFLSCISSLGEPIAQRGRVRRFRRGLDYTVAHHGLLTKKSVLDATVCFVVPAVRVNREALKSESSEPSTREENAEEEDVWESGDVGGFECYIEADDEETEAAAEYNQYDDTELLSVSASFNTLSLVFRDPGTMRFVKYVGINAPSSRWDIAMEYIPREQDDDDEESEEEKEATNNS